MGATPRQRSCSNQAQEERLFFPNNIRDVGKERN